MRKKITSLALLLMCCVFSALAQKVAETPTTNFETGFYVIKSFSNRTAKDGVYLYANSNNIFVENVSESFNLGGKTLNSDELKYVWDVTKNSDGSIQIKQHQSNTYIGSFKKTWDGFANGMNYTKSANLNVLNYSKDESSFLLRSVEDYDIRTSRFNLNEITSKVYVVQNDGPTMSYWYYNDQSSAEKDEAVAKFQFYKVDEIPELVNINYDYYLDGNKKASKSISAAIGKAFPNVYPTDYIGITVPERLVTAEDADKTFDIECKVTTPFKTSTDDNPYYYYLVNGTDTRNRVYANGSSLAIRTDGQATHLNDVRGDLWYVKGNPFDGFQFSSVGSGHLAKSSAVLSNSSLCSLAFSGSMSTDTWKIYKIDDEAFGVYGYSTSWTSSGNNVAWTNDGNNRIGFEKGLSTTDATKTFRLIPATITMPLNYSEADDKTFATTCLPYAVEVAEGQDNIKAYAGKLNDEKTELQMNAVTAVPANQGVILSGESASDDQVVLNVIASADAIDNDLLGTTTEISTEGILSFGRAEGTGNVGFFRSGNATLPANRAYIKLSDESIQSLAMNFGTVTGINNATNSSAVKSNAPIYDLSGRRVFNTVKGSLYIQQGRKFIAK